MKQVLKWISYIFLTFILMSAVIILFLLNSTKTIQWAADTYAPQYGFGYKQISGGLLTGLEVEALTFKDDLLLDNLKVGWNPAAILYKKISITHLEAKGLNVANIKKTTEAFIPTESKEKNTSAFVLPVTIGVGELSLSAKPFDESGIGFKNISLEGEEIVYDGEDIDIDDLSLLMDTNVTTLKLNGYKEGKKIKIKTLSMLDLDTTAFQDVIDKMIEINLYEDITEYVEPEIENYKAGRENTLPNNVEIDSFIVMTRPGDHPRLRLNRGEMNATSVKLDIYGIIDFQSDTLEMQSYSMLLDTSLGSLSMKSKLEGERIIVDSLSLQDIDTVGVTQFVRSIENNQTLQSELNVPHKDESIETKSMANSFLPKYLYLKHMDSSIKNVAYNNLLVKSAEVNATNVLLNMRTFIAQSGEVDINAVSNLVSLSQHGVIKDNHIKGMGQLTVHKELLKMYDLPLNKATFNPLAMNMMIDKKQVVIDFDLKDGELLQSEERVFTVEDLSLINQIVYRFSEGKLSIKNEGNISTLHAKELYVENLLTLKDGLLGYKGKIIPGQLEGIDGNYTKPLNDLIITYQGDTKSIEALIDSEGVEGKLTSADLKKGDLTFSTKQAFELKNFISLPKELNASKVSVDMHLPLDVSALFPLKANAKISSNLATIDADIVYDKEWKVVSKTIFPQDSLLRTFSPKLNLDALSPLEVDLSLFEKSLHMDIRSEGLRSQITLNTENKDLNGSMVLAGAEFVFKGNVEKELSLENSTSSLEGLLKKISMIYAFEVPPLDGDARVSLVMTDLQDLALKLNSNTLRYKAEHIEHILNDTMLSLGYSDGVLALNKYYTTFKEENIFATKPSRITLKEGNVEIAPLWINDELKVTGKYNIENRKGEIHAFSELLNVSHDMADLRSRIDVKTTLKGDETAVNGTITILGGEIHYDMNIKTFSSDRDIVNAEELKKKKNSVFMDNLSTSININTEKPFIYKTEEIDMKANADLWLQKSEKGPLRMLGMVEILEGSSYRFKDKKFGVKKGSISFTGDPNNLILDIVATYKTVQAEISIHATGSPANPEIVLSSIPPMDRERILSTILFGTQVNDQDMSEDDMMNMMGGTMARSVFSNTGTGVVKSAFSSVGININSIPFIGDSTDADQSEKKLFSFFSREEGVVIPHHEIHFKGQKDVDEKALQKAMGVDTKSIFQFWKEDKSTINDKLLPTLEQSLRNFYDSKGFYDAAFSIEISKTDVIVNIQENEPVKIKDINISSDHDISKLITINKGQIFRSKEFVSIKKDIIENLLKEGYCSYDLDSKAYVYLDRHEVDVRFKLTKGDLCTFGKTSVEGLETIDDSVVISRVRAREGERFNIERIRETRDEIYALDAFDSVSVRHDRKYYNVVPIDVKGTEVASPWYVKGDVDYDTEVGLGVSAQLLRTNFMGNAKNISLGFVYSSIDKVVELSYFIPAFVKISDYYIDLTSKIGYSEFKYTGFKDEKAYGKVFLSYNDEKLSLNTGFSIENIDISLLQVDNIHTIEAENFLPLYPFFNFVYDSRDSKFNPKNGYYIEGEVEYGLPYDDKASSYLKYSLEGRVIHSFKELTLAAVAKAGIVEQHQNETPESKLFFAGGVNSNRAYGYKRVGVIFSPTVYGISGGATMANLSLEANYPIYHNLYAAVFSDNTMLTEDEYDFNGDILSAVGLGVRYITPIGPIKLDLGMNVHDTSKHAIHFQIGQSF